MMGGGDDDPVARVTGSIGGLGSQLESIQTAIGAAVQKMKTDPGTGHPLQPTLRNIYKGLELVADAQKARAAQPDPAAAELSALRELLGATLPQLAAAQGEGLGTALAGLTPALQKLARPKLDVTVHNEPPAGIDELLAQQVAIIERTLVPLVRTTTKNLNDSVSIGSKLDELMVLLHQIDAQLSIGGPSFDIEIDDDDGAATQRMPAVKGPGK